MTSSLPVELFAPLNALPGVRHCFTTRVPGVDVQADKAEALRRLDQVHRGIRKELCIGSGPLVTAQQVHGNAIGVVDTPITNEQCFDEVDGLITSQREVCLGIYVADCCAVYLVDPVRHAIGLVHSGRKGTELGITTSAIELMHELFGTEPGDLVVQLSPCIRPPHYEVDFAAEIAANCRAAGVRHIHDSGICTACDLQSYYSYRAEKAKTGRMLALLAMTSETESA
jgi:polyphenol oxidase